MSVIIVRIGTMETEINDIREANDHSFNRLPLAFE